MKKRAVISVNIAVLLFGLAGLFAKWIHQPALVITFGRVFFSSVSLGIYMIIRKQSFHLSDRKDLYQLAIAGAVLAVHWWTFLEPMVFRQPLKPRNVLFAVLLVIGVLVTIPEFSVENNIFLGILVGMVSALAYAVLTVMNKGFAGRYSGTLTAFYEQATAAVLLLPFVMKMGIHLSLSDFYLLLFLGIVTTALAHTLFISSLKEIPAQLAGVCSSMETVYGILFALLLLGEVPSMREIVGAVIIVAVVITAQIM